MKNYIGCDSCKELQEITTKNISSEKVIIDGNEYIITILTCINCNKVYVLEIDTAELQSTLADNMKLLTKIYDYKQRGMNTNKLQKRWETIDKEINSLRNSFKKQLKSLSAKCINSDKVIIIEYLEAYSYE